MVFALSDSLLKCFMGRSVPYSAKRVHRIRRSATALLKTFIRFKSICILQTKTAIRWVYSVLAKLLMAPVVIAVPRIPATCRNEFQLFILRHNHPCCLGVKHSSPTRETPVGLQTRNEVQRLEALSGHFTENLERSHEMHEGLTSTRPVLVSPIQIGNVSYSTFYLFIPLNVASRGMRVTYAS